MDLALYQPEHGYYLGTTVRSAREGDFLTAPELHPIFGRVVARQIGEMWELLGRPARFTIREYGAGPGTLGVTILSELRDRSPAAFASMTYDPVEVNEAHRRTLLERFEATGLTDRLVVGGEAVTHDRPHRPSGDLGRPFVGCVIANEFLDALPVHLVEGAGGGAVREVFVTWRDGWLAEEVREPSSDELFAHLERSGIVLEAGQRAEVNLGTRDWLDEVAGVLERGYVVVIDYGHEAAELYAPKRRAGTLLGYRGHTVGSDPFAFVGRQDLTAHVDVTALKAWASERGLVPLVTTTQGRFLVDGGLEELLEEERSRPELGAEEYLALRASILRLLDPRALGGFQVVLLGRDVPRDRPPSGFRSRDVTLGMSAPSTGEAAP